MKKFSTLMMTIAIAATLGVVASAEEETIDTVVTSAEVSATETTDADEAEVTNEASETAEEQSTEAMTEATAEEANADDNTTDDKGSPDTGVASAASVAGTAILAGGIALLASKKRTK